MMEDYEKLASDVSSTFIFKSLFSSLRIWNQHVYQFTRGSIYVL